MTLSGGLKLTPSVIPGGCLLALEGVLDESFNASALGVAGGGVVVIDMSGVSFVTSYGIRDWSRALAALPRSYLGYVNVRPVIVSQFNMVQRFSGGGEVLSLFAPYICTACAKEFEVHFDVRRNYDRICAFELPVPRCPACQGIGELDEPPATFFRYITKRPAPNPPPLVDELLRAARTAGASFKLDKEIEGGVTVLRCSGALDSEAPLRRAAVGLQSPVVVLFEFLTNVTEEGVLGLLAFLQTGNTEFFVGMLPEKLAILLAPHAASLPRVSVLSIQLKLICAHCKSRNNLDVGREELESNLLSERQIVCAACQRAIPVEVDDRIRQAFLALPHQGASPPEVADVVWGATQLRPKAQPARAAPALGEEMPQETGWFFGRFKLVRLLGTGGMAEVLLARQSGAAGFAKTVVVKRMLPHLSRDERFVEMFLNEGRVASRISHPNIVNILDLGEMAGGFFIALEYVQGWDLDKVLMRARKLGKPPPLNVACYIVASVCAGLHAAHTAVDETGQVAAIIHRDVSPHNTLLSRDGFVKVGDFGIAQAVEATKKGAQVLAGKVGYMAPEQVRLDAPIDHRVDIFACGVLAYELVALRNPFERSSAALTLRATVDGDVPPLADFRKGVPQVLEQIIHRALHREAASRYPTALAMQQQLERYLAQTEPAGPSELAKWLAELEMPEAGTGDVKASATTDVAPAETPTDLLIKAPR